MTGLIVAGLVLLLTGLAVLLCREHLANIRAAAYPDKRPLDLRGSAVVFIGAGIALIVCYFVLR